MNLSEADVRAALYCAAELIRSRQRTGAPIPDWLRRHYHRLNTEFGMSQSGHGIAGSTEQLEDDKLITAKEAAALLGKSKRQIQRLAADLDGKIIGGRWLFNRASVTEYAEGENSA